MIGSFLYQAGGYSAPFLFYGIIFLLASIFLKKIIPSKVDEKPQENQNTGAIGDLDNIFEDEKNDGPNAS